jgi:MYXO-CTERM domain-containing protein
MRIAAVLTGVVVAGALTVAQSANAVFLLDNGTDGASDGWAVSGANQAFGGFSQFQMFTVTDALGWAVNTIGVDGYINFDPNNVGVKGTLLPDVGGSPDEDNPIADSTYFLTTDPFGGPAWVDEAFSLILAQGDYWFRLEAGDADVNAAWRDGFSGGNAFSRRNSDGAEFAHGPLALRIEGEIAPAPGGLALLLVGFAGTRRRRR